MKTESSLSKDKLISSWDEYTSPARFAGSDDIFDDIFISKRKGDKVVLKRRPRASFDMFSTVFRGKLCEDGTGSCISGVFTVGIADYIVSFLIAAVYAYTVYTVYERNGSTVDGKVVLLAVIGCALLWLALRPKSNSKKKYKALFDKIAEKG